jgi:hypothetical protein
LLQVSPDVFGKLLIDGGTPPLQAARPQRGSEQALQSV